MNIRGRAYHGLGEYQRAIQDLDEAIRLNPEYAEAYNNRGIAHGMLGNSVQAEQDFAKSKELGFVRER
jgi:serine protease Do